MDDGIYELWDPEEDDPLYMKNPDSKSVRGFIEALTIFSKYMKKGLQEPYFCQAEHDELYIHVDTELLHPRSPDGEHLRALGFHPSDIDTWSYFT